MADLKITNVPQGSSVGTTDDIYIKTGSNFRRVPVSKLVELMGAQGFFQKGLDGIPTTDLYVEKVVIAPDDDSFVSSKTYSQISAAEEAGAEIQCEFQPGDGSYLRGMVLDITDSEALLAFLVPGPGPHISIFAVADLTVTETRIPISGQPCRAVCNTEEETTAKTAEVQGAAGDLFSLYDGATVYVYFTNGAFPGSTLNVNNTGAKLIDFGGAGEISAGTYVQLFYQEALGAWVLVGGGIPGGGSGITDDIKTALLACFAHVAWADEHGQDYYDALEDALYPPVPVTLLSITADYQQDHTIYNTDTLDAIKAGDDLTVTANYSDGTSVVLDDDDYTLSGTLTVGTSTITVSYGGKTAEISVVVSSYKTLYKLSDGDVVKEQGANSIASGSPNGLSFGLSSIIKGRRRSFPLVSGDDGNEYYGTSNDSTWTMMSPKRYPIPVPANATKIKATITPATQYVNITLAKWNGSKYANAFNDGWHQGSQEVTITSGMAEMAMVLTKHDSGGTSYPTEPSEMIIEFTTE